jgi:hypothetical protein
MAVVFPKSTQITGRDSTPRVPIDGRVQGGMLHHGRGVIAFANGDSIASIARMFSIPSNAIPKSIQITCPDIGTTTAADVGLYRTTQDGGAVVDADFFASAVSLSGGALNKVDVTFESGVITLANTEKPIWQLLGLTSDPQVMYDVCLTLTAAADAAGGVLLEGDWTQ